MPNIIDVQVKTGDNTFESLVLKKAPIKETTFTLNFNGWQASKQQTVSVANLTESTYGVLGISNSATEAQYLAASNAQIRIISQGTGSLTVEALGTVPTVNIPCVITDMYEP